MSAEDPSQSDARFWWALIQKRLSDVQLTLPEHLEGIYQCVVIDGPPPGPTLDAFYLRLLGRRSFAVEGMAEHYHTWLFVDRNAVGDVIFERRRAQAFWVGGDMALHHALWRELGSAPQIDSPWGLRASLVAT